MSVPQVLGGRYRLVERLGSGGMSVVWRGHDAVLDRFVAIKVLSAQYAAEPGFRERIRTEAQAAARLTHPYVAHVHDFGESRTGTGQSIPYVVMELLSGPTLAERLAAGPMRPAVAVRVCAQVAAALAAAHAHGLVHCDVKPGNIMLTPDGAKVVDFGIASVAGRRHDTGASDMVLGTPAYLAPERLRGGGVLPASDVYALGLVLYRALTGDLPWSAQGTKEILHAHVHLEPAPLPRIKDLPSEVAEVYRQCLAKDPAERPPAHAVAAALASAAGVEVPGAADRPATLRLDTTRTLPIQPHHRPRRRLRLAAVSAGLAVSAAAAGAFALGPGQIAQDGAANANTGQVTPTCAPAAACTPNATAPTPAPRPTRGASGEGGAASVPSPSAKPSTPSPSAPSPDPGATTTPGRSPSASPSQPYPTPTPSTSQATTPSSGTSTHSSTASKPRQTTSPDKHGSHATGGDQGDQGGN